jgi:uncharacterized protein YuzE
VKLRVDREADALDLAPTEEPADRSEALAPGLIVDYAVSGEIVGIEMLHLYTRGRALDVRKLEFETA